MEDKKNLNLPAWMQSLPDPLKKIPIIYLAIPGSHDSMSFGINSSSKIGPDAEPILKNVYKFLPWIVRRWCITQKLNFREQLFFGIR